MLKAVKKLVECVPSSRPYDSGRGTCTLFFKTIACLSSINGGFLQEGLEKTPLLLSLLKTECFCCNLEA